MSSSAADRAAELRAKADALEATAQLEEELLEAKESGDKERIRAASEALREARSTYRDKTAVVGGDAFAEPAPNGEEG